MSTIFYFPCQRDSDWNLSCLVGLEEDSGNFICATPNDFLNVMTTKLSLFYGEAKPGSCRLPPRIICSDLPWAAPAQSSRRMPRRQTSRGCRDASREMRCQAELISPLEAASCSTPHPSHVHKTNVKRTAGGMDLNDKRVANYDWILKWREGGK